MGEISAILRSSSGAISASTRERGIDDLHQYYALPFLRPLFGDAVLDPIRLHVDAKRCLCVIDAAYLGQLSEDSVRSLALQGGVFSDEQARAFLAREHAVPMREIEIVDFPPSGSFLDLNPLGQVPVLVADGIALSYYDGELNNLSQVPLYMSHMWFLLKEKVKLGGDVTITAFKRAPGAFQIGLVQTDEPDAGSVVLEFGDRPLELRQWTITDNKNQEVRVGLYDAHFGVQPANELFATPQRKSKRN